MPKALELVQAYTKSSPFKASESKIQLELQTHKIFTYRKEHILTD